MCLFVKSFYTKTFIYTFTETDSDIVNNFKRVCECAIRSYAN